MQHYETPLLTALVDGRTEVAKRLIACGANLEAPNMIRSPDGSGFAHTALHTTTSRQIRWAFDLLVTSGANVDRQTTLGWTAMHFAAQKDDTIAVASLLRGGASWGLRDVDGNRPVDLAGPKVEPLIS